MHLILSSCDFQNENSRKSIIKNLGIPIEMCKVLYIPNEKATLNLIQSDLYNNRVQEFGFQKENVTVFNYYDSNCYINLQIDAIYISGGNTLKTLDRLKKCGFDKAIINYVNIGVTYIGGSAGAHIASKNVEHIIAFDGNETGVTDFEGLGLFDGILFCHYTEARKKYYEEALLKNKYKVYALTDDDAIIINK
jgi:peptidase E